MNSLKSYLTIGIIVASLVTFPALLFAETLGGVTSNKVISATANTQALTAAQSATTTVANTTADSTADTTTPTSSSTQAEWSTYFTKMISAINALSDTKEKATSWKTLLTALTEALTNGSNISKETCSTILSKATAFLSSTAFTGLDCSQTAVKEAVTNMVSSLINAMTTIANETPANIDSSVLNSAVTAVGKFLGTSSGYDMGTQFSKLDKTQKETIINAFVALANKTVNSSATITAETRLNIANNVSRMITAQMKELYRNSDYSIDITSATKSVVAILKEFGTSTTFNAMTTSQKRSFLSSTTYLAVELFWRSESNSTNQGYVDDIAAIYTNTFKNGTVEEKAVAVNYLTNIYRSCAYNNATVAKNFLKEALSANLSDVTSSLLSAMDSTSLTNEQKATVATALLNLVAEQTVIKDSGTGTLSDATLKSITTKVTAFITNVNNGTISVSLYAQKGLVEIGGLALAGSVTNGTHKTTENSALLSAYLTFAKNALLTSSTESVATDIKVSAINKLTILRNAAISKSDTDLSAKIKEILLDENFNAESFVSSVKSKVSGLTGVQADSGAWYCSAITNLASIYLKEGSTTSDNYTYLKSNVNTIVDTVKSWISNADNLNNMRLLGWQEWLYESLFSLAKQVYKDGTVFTSSELTSLASSFKTVFGTISGLKDDTVKSYAASLAKSFVSSLADDDDLKTYITSLGLDDYKS